jgi:hypothetical protein
VSVYADFHENNAFNIGLLNGVQGALSMGVKLTTHFHLYRGQRISGAIPPITNTLSWGGAELKESTGTTLPFYLSLDEQIDTRVYPEVPGLSR